MPAKRPEPAPPSRRGGFFLFRAAALALWASALQLPPGAVPAVASGVGDGFETATVLEVVDGDTIRVRNPGGDVATVRLVGIDAPERGHPARPREYLADEAAEALSAMCAGKAVRLEADREEADRYGRRLRFVFSPDGRTLLNRELVRSGLARVYRRVPFSRLAEFEAAEADARREGLGVWRDGGLEELRAAVRGNREPVSVRRLGGGLYGISLGGTGKAGIGEAELAAEIERLVRLRAEHSDGDFADAARKAGFGPVVEEPAPVERLAPRAPSGSPAADPTPGTGNGSGGAAHPAVPWERARERVGEAVEVEGVVVRTKRSGRALFLNFHPNWKRYLTVVLFPGALREVPGNAESLYLGRRIRVRGVVRIRKDRPEIVVGSASDIRLVP